MFARSVIAAVVVSSLFFSPLGANAEPAETPAPSAPPTPLAEHARDGGIISGKISSVDFQRSIITINKIGISVMPSTQIQGNGPGYHAITDLKPGMAVDVYTSQIAGRYIAQIITLK
jgi:hypothetical protein